MDPALTKGFAIGFLAVTVGAGIYLWRQGSPSPPADPPAAAATPDGAGRPKGEAPSASAKPSGGLAAIEPLVKDAATGAAPGPPSRGADPAKGAFDVVRVEPSGEMVVAGRCAANCTATLTVDGRPHETAKADGSGHWAMTPPALPPGDHRLGLIVTTPDGATATSEQSVAVSTPKAPSGEAVVVLDVPNAPSKVLQRPGQPSAAGRPPETAAADVAAVSIVAVDAEKGRLFIQGAAPAEATLRVYLNDTMIAEPVAGGDGRWSVRVERGLTPGDYAVRVDRVETASGKVVARAEARFAYEGEVAETAPSPPANPVEAAPAPAFEPKLAAAPPAAQPATVPIVRDEGVARPSEAAEPVRPGEARAVASSPANPVVASIDTAKVARGDSLWRISRRTYGRGMRYTVIFSANDKQIREPDLIYPGQVLVLPGDAAGGAVAR